MLAGGQERSPIALSDLSTLADKYRDTYIEAKPWPHLVLEDLVDPEYVAAAEDEEIARALNLGLQKEQGIVKAESPEVDGDAAQAILDSLLAPEFITFLERLTGISDLIGEPSHLRAGLHVNPPGAFQALHRDFRRHSTTQHFHRINVLVFLNSGWAPEYGGALELWPQKAKTAAEMQRILPEAGRVVIFETTATSYHAVSDPVACPPGRARLSLASYYYTQLPGPNDRRDFKLFVPRRPQDPVRIDVQKFRDVVKGVAGRLGSR